MSETIEERVLAATGIEPKDEAEKKYLLGKITEIISGKLILACAESFSELEMSRLEYLLEQKDIAKLDSEIDARIPDGSALMQKVEVDTMAEIKDLMKEISAPA